MKEKKEIYTSKEPNPRRPISRGEFVVQMTAVKDSWVNEIERLNKDKLQTDLKILVATENAVKATSLMRDALLAEKDEDIKVNYFANEVDNQLHIEIKSKGRFGFLRGGGR